MTGRATTGFASAWVLLCIVAAATTDLASGLVPDKAACRAAFEGEKFAGDDQVIGCIRGATDACCERIDEYLGLETPFANCSCSDAMLSEVIEDSIPKFAVDLILERIHECGTVPLSGGDVCGDSSSAHAFAADCVDTPPPYSDFTCVQQAGWGKCDEAFMRGYCEVSCQRCATGEAAPAEEDQVEAASVAPTASRERFEEGREGALAEGE